MPSKPLRPCNKIGCPNLTSNRYCDEHMHLLKQKRSNRSRDYDKQRGSAAKRGYDAEWRKYREEFLRRNPICVRCGAPATVVDHIIPHKGNRGLFWTKFNHQSLCKSCHDRKTVKEDGGFGNGQAIIDNKT